MRSFMLTAVVLLFGLSSVPGCSSISSPDREARKQEGYTFYLDGAGGAGVVTNWSHGVRRGFIDAGYEGAGEVFVWQTGLGVVPDQNSSVSYKRKKAAELAQRICAFKREHPDSPVSIIGLSAGSAIAVFTLEALPENEQVDCVILLSSSISNDYDLTAALKRVRGKLYVFTSEQDGVLRYLVPISGTADRQKAGAASAGLRGFYMPRGSSVATAEAYSKVVHVRWRKEFERAGHRGGHTDVVNAKFVRQYIAPLVMKAKPTRPPAPLDVDEAAVANPDYERWAAFRPGAWVQWDGVQEIGGRRERIQITATLVAAGRDRIVIERRYDALDSGGSIRVQDFFAAARIKPEEHPFTHPAAQKETLPDVTVSVGSRTERGKVEHVKAKGDFPEWGRDVECTVYHADWIPGGAAKVVLNAYQNGEPYRFEGWVMAFGAGR